MLIWRNANPVNNNSPETANDHPKGCLINVLYFKRRYSLTDTNKHITYIVELAQTFIVLLVCYIDCI